MNKWLLITFFSCTSLLAYSEPSPIGTRQTHPEIIEAHKRAWEIREEKFPNFPEVAKSFFSSAPIHVGAYHHYQNITRVGDTIELEDGSVWSIKPSDRFKTYNWYTTDTLTITPNHSWFSGNYNFCITNITQNESLEVLLKRRPLYNGLCTYWITAIDTISQQLHLSDGSVWSLSSLHYMTFKDWMVNDTIIIGHNDGFFAKTWGNILINCETNSHAEARCTQ